MVLWVSWHTGGVCPSTGARNGHRARVAQSLGVCLVCCTVATLSLEVGHVVSATLSQANDVATDTGIGAMQFNRREPSCSLAGLTQIAITREHSSSEATPWSTTTAKPYPALAECRRTHLAMSCMTSYLPAANVITSLLLSVAEAS